MYGYGIGAPATQVPHEYNLLAYIFMGVAVAGLSAYGSTQLRHEATAIAQKPYTEADKVFKLSPADQRRVASGLAAILAAVAAGGAVGAAGSLASAVRKKDEEPSSPTTPHQG